MELQFYGPGYVPQFEGFGCTAHQYCAAMTYRRHLIASTRQGSTRCNNYVLGGIEPINWAYITRNGNPRRRRTPCSPGLTNPNFSAVNPNPAKDLFMNPGDRIRIHMHDTPAGFRIDLTDLTTGQHGSMTASVANGFGHILYTPKSSTCQEAPYAFHPEYSTANPRGNTWSLHTYNVAMSDEIGHFENCLAIDANGNCTARRQDRVWTRTTPVRPGTDSTVVKIDGCFAHGRLGRAVLPPGLAVGTNPNRSWTGPCTRRRCCSPARRPREELLDDGSSRPTCRGSRSRARRPTRRSATRYRRQLRESAERRAVLPDLLHHVPARIVHVAGGRQIPPRHHQQLRRHVHR